ncbi:MAG: citrate (Si)-synthase [Planctomycetota bacterium]|nr:MAG: citrate (Si)-synthase [Planctomycetota bacterium]
MSNDPKTSASNSPDTARLIIGDQEIELPLIRGSEDELAIDIRQLRAKTGAITHDPGFGNTGSCQSRVTFLDGAKGILRYRGYPIEQLAENSSFIEVAWLLMEGELPSQEELKTFRRQLTLHSMLHEDLRGLFASLPKRGHPMAICAATVAALSTFYQDLKYATPAEQRQASSMRLLAKFPTIAAFSYKHSIGQPYMYPRNDLLYTENILHMLFATPCEPYQPDPLAAKALNLLLILHADHEQNCSTSTVRTVGSAQANLYASVSAGINALWGPLHGGANQKVIEMLVAIEQGGLSPQDFMEKAKDKNSNVRLMGFGHRVYKNYDPRARILKKSCDEVLANMGKQNALLQIAQELEAIALADDYFVERHLYPNVDFYSGIIYQALGIPIDMFTVFFAMGRLPGWISQWLEHHADTDSRIIRPRQIYQGPRKRDYIPLEDR